MAFCNSVLEQHFSLKNTPTLCQGRGWKMTCQCTHFTCILRLDVCHLSSDVDHLYIFIYFHMQSKNVVLCSQCHVVERWKMHILTSSQPAKQIPWSYTAHLLNIRIISKQRCMWEYDIPYSHEDALYLAELIS